MASTRLECTERVSEHPWPASHSTTRYEVDSHTLRHAIERWNGVDGMLIVQEEEGRDLWLGLLPVGY